MVSGYGFNGNASWLFPLFLQTQHVNWAPTFQENLNNAIKGKHKEPYSSAHALLLSWTSSDLDVQGEMDGLSKVLEDRYSFIVDRWSIPNILNDPDGSTNAVEEKLIAFRRAHNDPSGLFLIYYGGHGGWDSRENSLWMS